MSLLFCDGFDHYYDDYDNIKWDVHGNAPDIYPSPNGRRGGGCLMIQYVDEYISKIIPASTTAITGFAIKSLNSINSGTENLIEFRDFENGVHIGIRVYNPNNSPGGAYLRAYRGDGTTLLGTTTDRVFKFNRWQYIEAKATISDTVGEVHIRVGGETVLSLTGIDTKEQSNAYIDEVRYTACHGNSDDIFLDDLYICNDSGTVNNDFLGDIKVTAHFPDSDGAHTDFTPSTGTSHYATVDESLISESDYNDGDTLNDIDSYGITAASDLGTIHGIQVVSCAQNPDVGTRKIKTVVRSNSVDYVGSNEETLSNTSSILKEVFETDPDDSAAWTKTKLDAAEFGIKITQ